MYKIIDAGSWDSLESQGIAHILPFCKSGSMTGNDRRAFFRKTAASEKFLHEMDSIKLADGDIPVHLNAIGASEHYGCFAAGTPIALGNGQYVPIESLEVGDEVLSADGNICEVDYLFSRHVNQTLSVDVCGLSDNLVCSLNHPFRVARLEQFVCCHDKYKLCLPRNFGKQNICKRNTIRSGGKRACVSAGYPEIRWEWAEASTLRAGDYLVWTPPDIVPPISMSVYEGYLLGAWLANGCFQKNSSNKQVKAIIISINAYHDVSLRRIEKCARVIGLRCRDYVYAGEHCSHTRKNDGTWHTICGNRENERSVYISGNPERFRTWKKYFNEYAKSKRLPPWVCCLPQNVKLAIIAGYIDGDGCCVVGKKDNRVTVRSSGDNLSLGMQRLCWSAGIMAVRCIVRREGYWNLSMACSSLVEICKYSWKLHSRPLRQLSPTHGFTHKGRVYLPVRAIYPSDPQTVYNFEVAGDHTYSGPNIDSHNCNRKGDCFSEHTCSNWHHTFVTEGRNYLHHKNRDPKYSFGKVASSCYNENMHRIELLVASNGNEAAAKRNGGLVLPHEFLDKLEKNASVPVSMGAYISFDFCLICGNKARTRNEYCDETNCRDPKTGEYFPGCKHGLMKIASDGRIQCVDNIEPHFFDISFVGVPADRTGYGFRADYLEARMPKTASIDPERSAEEWLGLPVFTGWKTAYQNEMMDMLGKLAAFEQTCQKSQDEARYAFGVYALSQDSELGTKLAAMMPNTKIAALRLLANRGVFLSPENFATAFGFDKTAGEQIRGCSGSAFGATHRRYSQCRRDALASVLAGLDQAHSIKQAEICLPENLIDTSVVTLGNIVSCVPAGLIRYAMKKQASLSGSIPQYREVVEAYTLYKTAALCRFPDAMKPFGVKLAVWQNF